MACLASLQHSNRLRAHRGLTIVAQDSLNIMDEPERCFKRGPTPPLPVRNPDRRHSNRNYPLVAPNSSARMTPKPLFSKRTGLPPMRIHVQVHDSGYTSHPSSAQSSGPSSPSASCRSFASYASSASSASTVSGPGSVSNTPRSRGCSFPPADVCNWDNEWDLSHNPNPRLRRTKTPKRETLRELRAKASEACLQRAYEQQVELYLNGALFPRAKWKANLGYLEEE